jgi:hypothetical protein
VEVAGGATLVASSYVPFGTTIADVPAKVKGDGTLDLTALPGPITIPAGLTFDVGIDLTGINIALAGDATFNKALTVDDVENSGSSKLTLNGLTAIAGTLISNGSGTADALTIAGTGKVTVTGKVTATKPLVIENTNAAGVTFDTAANDFAAAGGSLEVKLGAKVITDATLTNPHLVFGPGLYTATGGVTYGKATITLTAATDVLTFGSVKLATATNGTTFVVTGTSGSVELGVDGGKGEIAIGAGSTFTLGGTAIVALGGGEKISFANTGVLAGIIASKTNPATGSLGASQNATDTVDTVVYDTGITMPDSPSPFTYATSGSITAATGTPEIVGTAPNGGVITVTTDIAS